jgi:sec-independent protein translocase protein TatA
MGLDNPIHILLLLIVLLLVFGAKRLPEMGRSLGDGMRGFKESLNGSRPHDSLSAVQTPETALTVAPPVPDAMLFTRAPSADSGDDLATHTRNNAVAPADSSAQRSTAPKAAA